MDETEVFATVRELVERGEYLDEIPGVPGARLAGGGCFRDDRRLYARGSAEYLDARAAGLTERLPPLTPAPIEAVEQAEALIGCALPSLLRRAYLELGDGGFGPGYGLLSLNDAIGLFRTARAEDGHHWRGPAATRLLAICDWGCGIVSFVDCASASGRMWAWDPNPPPQDQLAFALFKEDIEIVDWFGRWAQLRLAQPTLVQDPASGEWRGATAAEHAAWADEMAGD